MVVVWIKSRLLTCVALQTQQLVFRFQGQTQTVEVEHTTALTFTGNQVLTSLLTNLNKRKRKAKRLSNNKEPKTHK